MKHIGEVVLVPLPPVLPGVRAVSGVTGGKPASCIWMRCRTAVFLPPKRKNMLFVEHCVLN